MNKNIFDQIDQARGIIKADLVFKNAQVVNVFINKIEKVDVAITNGVIVGLGQYNGIVEVDLKGKFLVPGLVESHIHLESSLLLPHEFASVALVNGTTTCICDPHEIVNVAGNLGLEFMLEMSEGLDLDFYFMLPSCIPTTPLDENGGEFGVKEIKHYLNHPRILGLAEVMNDYGILHHDKILHSKLNATNKTNKVIDGHAPLLSGKDLNAYIGCNIKSDHECTSFDEAVEKISRGQYIMIRQGSAAKNLDDLHQLFNEPYCNRTLLCSDDKDPFDLVSEGHINHSIKKAIQYGHNPILAIKMASLNACEYFGLKNKGAIAPGYLADLLIVDNLKEFNIIDVYKNGVCVVKENKLIKKQIKEINKDKYFSLINSINIKELEVEDIKTIESNNHKRVIWLEKHQLLTKDCMIIDDGHKGILKLVALERHHNTNHIGLGYLGGYGLSKGAIAISFAHDSHNIIATGTNDDDIVMAINHLKKIQGGFVVVEGNKILVSIPLIVGGLISNQTIEEVVDQLKAAKTLLYELGIDHDIDPFMTLAFCSLSVIPYLRLTTKGLIQVNSQKIVENTF